MDLHSQKQTTFRPAAHSCAQPMACERTAYFPLAKHAGFSAAITMIIASNIKTTVQSLSKFFAHRQDQREARKMLELDNHALDDMALNRADIRYVLSTPSPLSATTRLKLLSVERRATNRRDYQNRAAFFESLLPPILAEASLKTEKNAQNDKRPCGNLH